MAEHLLITGASGFLGWKLAHIARRRFRVSGLCHAHNSAIPGVSLHQADLAQTHRIAPLLERIKPDAVIHLAAMSSPNQCEQQAALSQALNVDATEAIGRWCQQHAVPLVFSSSSQVYDGEQAPYSEHSPCAPRNRYGEQKLAAENALRRVCPQATVCRVPLMYGAAPPAAASSLQPVLQALHSGRPIKLFTDEIRSSLGARAAAEGLLRMLEVPAELLILAGDEALSRYEFGLRVAAYYGLDPAPLQPAKQADLPMAAGRPRDLTMRNARARSFGFRPLSVEDELRHADSLSAPGTAH
ncbi:sugar nucleotide-binding protein [Granulosicoccaceae sp. 1_MG-2023]|nr:sugar nucleotide-binding protein [Granulosicoccaceae sp. 1_MG-2023]